MGAQQSNLSADSYRYDLVAALTQDALNANLKQLIASVGAETQPLAVYYRYIDPQNRQAGTVEMTDAEVESMTQGFDIFRLPDGTTVQSPDGVEPVNRMVQAGFAYAFQVIYGLPAGISPPKMPNIISLTPQVAPRAARDLSQTVQYDMYFAGFDLLQLDYSMDDYTVRHEAQADDDPWIFQWLINLDLTPPENISYQDLPPTIQSHLKALYNLDPASMFSLRQLLLDLNSAELIACLPPTVVGMDPLDPLYDQLLVFLNGYWLPLVANGGLTFGNALQPLGTYPPSSLIPTALNFVISAPDDRSKPGLTTLNYLVMSEGHPMPSPIVPCNWDWVDASNPQVSGIMAVRRDIFLNYLNKALSPCLTPLCLSVKVDIDKGQSLTSRGNPDVTLQHTTPPRSYWVYAQNPCLQFSYQSSQKDSGTLMLPPQYNELQVTLKVDATVSLQGNTIRCETVVSLYYDFEVDWGLSTTKGYAMAQKNVTVFTLQAVGVGNTAGNLTAGMIDVTSQSTLTDLTQTENEKAPYYRDKTSGWSVFLTGNNSRDLEQQVNELSASLKHLMTDYKTAVTGIVNGSLSWVFPGAQTYFFANPTFSDALDLTSEISFQL